MNTFNTFHNNDLNFHLPRIVQHLKDEPDDIIKTPIKDDGDDGIDDVFYIDVDIIDESYLYKDEGERDSDHAKLMAYFTAPQQL